ncbi:hypothetical protein Taro_016888 [Colocasia esculenta]|uniref:Uncharacterized protein n=1 Tax=Colocasia esculenta TaxID=4460 RepID=A0A843UXP6_COLES|nr:hypothetical protein [Colocasia esculenta]
MDPLRRLVKIVLGSWTEILGALELGGGGVQAYEKAPLGSFFTLRPPETLWTQSPLKTSNTPPGSSSSDAPEEKKKLPTIVLLTAVLDTRKKLEITTSTGSDSPAQENTNKSNSTGLISPTQRKGRTNAQRRNPKKNAQPRILNSEERNLEPFLASSSHAAFASRPSSALAIFSTAPDLHHLGSASRIACHPAQPPAPHDPHLRCAPDSFSALDAPAQQSSHRLIHRAPPAPQRHRHHRTTSRVQLLRTAPYTNLQSSYSARSTRASIASQPLPASHRPSPSIQLPQLPDLSAFTRSSSHPTAAPPPGLLTWEEKRGHIPVITVTTSFPSDLKGTIFSMKVCRHTSHGVDTRPQVPRQKIDKFAKVCRHKPNCVSTRVGQSKNQATQVDTIADQVDTRPSSQNSQFEELGQEVDTLSEQVDTGHLSRSSSCQLPDKSFRLAFTSQKRPNSLRASKKLLAAKKSSCLLPLLSKCFQKTNFHQFKTPLKHSKEADRVEDFFGEEFEEDPTSQIAEHRLGLQASQISQEEKGVFALVLEERKRAEEGICRAIWCLFVRFEGFYTKEIHRTSCPKAHPGGGTSSEEVSDCLKTEERTVSLARRASSSSDSTLH